MHKIKEKSPQNIKVWSDFWCGKFKRWVDLRTKDTGPVERNKHIILEWTVWLAN